METDRSRSERLRWLRAAVKRKTRKDGDMKKPKKERWLGALVGAAFAALLFSGEILAADAGMSKMRFTQSGQHSSSWPLYVAQQTNNLREKTACSGSDIIRGATNLVRAVLSETVPSAASARLRHRRHRKQGAKVKSSPPTWEDPLRHLRPSEIKTGADIRARPSASAR